MIDAFAAASTEALLVIQANLRAGLDRVAASITDGTFDRVNAKGAAPPAETGHLTVTLLYGVTRELEWRGIEP